MALDLRVARAVCATGMTALWARFVPTTKELLALATVSPYTLAGFLVDEILAT